MDLILAIIILIICGITGTIIEKIHYKKIKKRELALYKKHCINFSKKTFNSNKVKNTVLVSGNVVIGCDHFKAFIASLKNLFGGNVSSYESCLDRGRREAILRMREQALNIGANIIVNVKIETINIEPIGSHKHPKVSVLAYGTALIYDK